MACETSAAGGAAAIHVEEECGTFGGAAFVAGSVAGGAAQLMGFPLDTLKVRAQIVLPNRRSLATPHQLSTRFARSLARTATRV